MDETSANSPGYFSKIDLVKPQIGPFKITDLLFTNFVSKLKFMAQKLGTQIVIIDRYFPSSQTCSHCGYVNHEVKDLQIRKWTCPHCGITHDRDVNASVNILQEGLRILEGQNLGLGY